MRDQTNLSLPDRHKPKQQSVPTIQRQESGTQQEESSESDLQMKPKAAPTLQMKCAACDGEDEGQGHAIQRQVDVAASASQETIKGMPKAEFFKLLKERLCNALNALFIDTPYTATNCPWI